MICPYCEKEAKWVDNSVVYGGMRYGKSYMCYWCEDCGAYVGCHQNSRTPLGSMATKELRVLRHQCHELFDPLWKSGKMKRAAAYKFLRDNTGVKHIAWTREDDCRLVIKFLKGYYDTN